MHQILSQFFFNCKHFILHDRSDEECVQILKKCKEAIPSEEKGGKVIVDDIIVGNQKDNFEVMETQLLFDIVMMLMLPGRERTVGDWANIFFLSLASQGIRLLI
ncbi:hypothetical protein ACS0TY_032674 [Phlomoides rotata]